MSDYCAVLDAAGGGVAMNRPGDPAGAGADDVTEVAAPRFVHRN